MDFHEAANIFPLLTGDEYRALRDDIEANGLIEPIWTYEGKILDGRNRYTACMDLGIEPIFVDYEGEQPPLDFVLSKNLHRRHLNETQRALVASKIANMRQGERTDSEPFANLQKVSIQEAADRLNVSRRTVDTVKAIEREAPELLPKLEAGEMTAHKAATIIKRQAAHEKRKAPDLPPGKYSVIYADPPWQYDNSGFDQSAEAHYPTMPLTEMKEMEVADLAGDPCALFLWATSPLLPEAFELMKAWGFEYKASRVWIKDKAPGIGWWVNTRHEHLLIGTKNGNAHPIEKIDSVINGAVTIHSRKPASVYSDIEKCYPGKKIELFARVSRPGWDAWGNEDV